MHWLLVSKATCSLGQQRYQRVQKCEGVLVVVRIRERTASRHPCSHLFASSYCVVQSWSKKNNNATEPHHKHTPVNSTSALGRGVLRLASLDHSQRADQMQMYYCEQVYINTTAINRILTKQERQQRAYAETCRDSKPPETHQGRG